VYVHNAFTHAQAISSLILVSPSSRGAWTGPEGRLFMIQTFGYDAYAIGCFSGSCSICGKRSVHGTVQRVGFLYTLLSYIFLYCLTYSTKDNNRIYLHRFESSQPLNHGPSITSMMHCCQHFLCLMIQCSRMFAFQALQCLRKRYGQSKILVRSSPSIDTVRTKGQK
jgi:hypothetical protein